MRCTTHRAGTQLVWKNVKPLHYKGSIFHRIIPYSMIQGCDFSLGDDQGEDSIDGVKFAKTNINTNVKFPVS